MQLLQPEIKEIQRRYKGDRTKVSEATMALYKERGVSPQPLPALVLQFVLLIPMYSVIRDGLTSYDPTAMLHIGPWQVPLTCQNLVNGVPTPPQPCIDPIAFGIDWSVANTVLPLPIIGGLSLLAVASGLLQLLQSRMVMPPPAEHDPQSSIQRQTMVIFPLISIAYGGFLPSVLFLYWIVTTVLSIIQQYLIVTSYVPGLRLDARLRQGPHAPVPGPRASSNARSPSNAGAAGRAADRCPPIVPRRLRRRSDPVSEPARADERRR
jgi:YidC/Oxa1 family membrane protein insertase